MARSGVRTFARSRSPVPGGSAKSPLVNGPSPKADVGLGVLRLVERGDLPRDRVRPLATVLTDLVEPIRGDRDRVWARTMHGWRTTAKTAAANDVLDNFVTSI